MTTRVQAFVTNSHVPPRFIEKKTAPCTAIYLKGYCIYANKKGLFFADRYPSPMVFQHRIYLPKDLADRIIEAIDIVSKAKSETTEIIENIFRHQTSNNEYQVAVDYYCKDDGSQHVNFVRDWKIAIDDCDGVYEADEETLQSKQLKKKTNFYITTKLAKRIGMAAILCSNAKATKDKILEEIEAGGYFELKTPSALTAIQKIENRQICKILCKLTVIFAIFTLAMIYNLDNAH